MIKQGSGLSIEREKKEFHGKRKRQQTGRFQYKRVKTKIVQMGLAKAKRREKKRKEGKV